MTVQTCPLFQINLMGSFRKSFQFPLSSMLMRTISCTLWVFFFFITKVKGLLIKVSLVFVHTHTHYFFKGWAPTYMIYFEKFSFSFIFKKTLIFKTSNLNIIKEFSHSLFRVSFNQLCFTFRLAVSDLAKSICVQLFFSISKLCSAWS